MRIAAIHLRALRLEVAGITREPAAVVIVRPGQKEKDEGSLLPQTRLDAISAAALALGVHPGMTVAAARARAALVVKVIALADLRAALERVAEAVLAFGTPAAIDEARDVVWLDVTGCARLHGGEPALVARLAETARALGHDAAIAIAGGPHLAAAVARHRPAIVAPGRDADALAPLPLAALPLPEEDLEWLGRLGLHRVRDLARLPRQRLALRLGARAPAVLALAAGDDPAPLVPFVPPEIPEESLELLEPIAHLEALRFVLKTLCDRLAARLQGRRVRATRLVLRLLLDRDERRLELACAAPLGAAAELLAVLAVKLERELAPRGADDDVTTIRKVILSAPGLAARVARMQDLFTPAPPSAEALPRLVAELVAELGPDRIGRLALADRWLPEARTVLVPWSPSPTQEAADLDDGPHAARLLAAPTRAPADAEPIRLLLRLGPIEWWRRPATLTEHIAAWVESAHAMAWLERDPETNTLHLRGWLE